MACLLNHSAQIMRPRSSVTASPRVSVRQAPAVRNVAVRIFKWGKNGLGAQDAGIVGAQMREDWSRSDVEFYFEYMGMLAVDGDYDKIHAYMEGMAPVDVVLLLACKENDYQKVDELLKSGANPDVVDRDSKTPAMLATDQGVLDLLRKAGAKMPVNA